MIQRKYPTNDQERYSVLMDFFDAIKTIESKDIPVSRDCYDKVRKTFGTYIKLIKFKEETYNRESKRVENYKDLYTKSRIYLVHYYRMMNMAIERKELKPEIRKYYGLNINDLEIPQPRNAEELIDFAQILFIGDTKRISEGGKYFTNPGIGVVKVWFEKYYEMYQEQQNTYNTHNVEVENIEEIRLEADANIKELWDNIEAEYIGLSEEQRMLECTKYGLVFELGKPEISTIDNEYEPSLKECFEEVSEAPQLQFSFTFPE